MFFADEISNEDDIWSNDDILVQHHVSINDSRADADYYCPLCDGPLVRRMGSQRAHHYAHMQLSSDCSDDISNEMSDWHIGWQNKFSKENQEVVFHRKINDDYEYGSWLINKTHTESRRADAFRDGVVFEFQHSSMSAQEFIDRTLFYCPIDSHQYIDCNIPLGDGRGDPPDSVREIRWLFDCRNKEYEFIKEYSGGNELARLKRAPTAIAFKRGIEYNEYAAAPIWDLQDLLVEDKTNDNRVRIFIQTEETVYSDFGDRVETHIYEIKKQYSRDNGLYRFLSRPCDEESFLDTSL